MVEVANWEWLLAILFLLGSIFCAGTETSLTALGEVRTHQLVDSGGRRARLLHLWLQHPDRVLSSLLIGNTLVNIGAGALAGDVASGLAAARGYRPGTTLAVATAVTTAVILLVGEIVPKTLAKRYPVRVALAAIPMVHVLYWMLWPVSTGIVRVTGTLMRLFGAGRSRAPAVTSEEIEYFIAMGTREGVLDEVKEELLNSVLEFADRVVKEIMIPRTGMVTIDRDAPPEEIVRIVTENPYSRIPVYEGSVDNVVGVLLVRDLIPELKKGPVRSIPLDRYLKPPFFVPEQMKISRLLKEMQRRKSHLAVVVDEFGGTSGLCTLEDVIEEIVGEIQDEADVEAAPVKPLGEGIYLADASVPLRDLEEYLNSHGEEPGDEEESREIRFPDDGDYETLGGFVTTTAGRVPAVGSLIAWDGLTFTVRGGDERRVTKVEIARRAPAASEPSAPERPAAR